MIFIRSSEPPKCSASGRSNENPPYRSQQVPSNKCPSQISVGRYQDGDLGYPKAEVIVIFNGPGLSAALYRCCSTWWWGGGEGARTVTNVKDTFCLNGPLEGIRCGRPQDNDIVRLGWNACSMQMLLRSITRSRRKSSQV
jgi:hypothetical protein